MDQVTVRKDKLRERLEENRKAHIQAFDAVWEAFRQQAEERAHGMYQAIIDARKGDTIRLSLQMQVPENHADDYTRAIEMLDFEVGDEVTLHEREFAQLVQDDWGWKQQFTLTGMAYVGDSGKYPGLR